MRILKSHTLKHGFTLVELLIGMVISTLIIGAAAGIFTTALSGWEKGQTKARQLQTARACIDVIENALRSAVTPERVRDFVFYGEDLSDGRTAGHRLIFLSSVPWRIPRSRPQSDVSVVEFVYDPLVPEGMTLRIDAALDDDLTEGGETIILCSSIRSFSVLYYDGFEWLDEWLESSELPLALEFQLTFNPTDENASDDTALSIEENPEEYFSVKRLVSIPVATSTSTEDSMLTNDSQSTGSQQSTSQESQSGSNTNTQGTTGQTAPSATSGGMR